MNLFNDVRDGVRSTVQDLMAEDLVPPGLDLGRVTVEPPRDPAHGDMATNAAMVLAKPAGLAPRDLARHLVERLAGQAGIETAEIAGPGFINMRLTPGRWLDVLTAILRTGPAYGTSTMGAGEAVNVEFVSANPTGPMHVGHARGAVFGDVLARLLTKAGYAVTREYYINDAGAQVDALARAVHARYLVAIGHLTQADFDDRLAAGAIDYGGDYLVPVAEAIANRDGTRWVETPESDWLPVLRGEAIDRMMAMIREDLYLLGVRHDLFSSERALVEAKRVDRLLADLEARDLVYTGVLEPPKGKTPEDWEPRPQTLFRATRFGDDVDRPLRKSDGSYTYFASDIAYHADKIDRGFLNLVNVLGADHGGYVKRLSAAVQAVSGGRATLDVKLIQLVKLLDDGEPVKMSKRAGTFVTLREVVEAVGRDVVRFIMLTRKNDATLDFDFARVTEQTRENPVFYVQYAHARGHSVLRHAGHAFPERDLTPAALATTADLGRLGDPDEQAMIRLLAGWPRLVESAAEAHEPHRIAFYLAEVAAAFHGLWNRGNDAAELRFLLPEDEATTLARLALVQAVVTVIASGLDIFGVQPMEEMR